jgi:serine/threonine protein kinase
MGQGLVQGAHMIGKTISHYRILEKLGEGGMGIVYKAHDIDLDRFVAIKGLPEHLRVQDVEYQRFMREARAASALNHPNVRTIYDFLKVNGTQYIVMEYVDGVTLREKLARGGPIPLTTAIACAIQIAEALQEAHDHGIVHRDVKPANIMMTARSQVKVMDFGLAKLKGAMRLTRTDSTLGTLAYMSPEQLQGGDVDPRSDLFSFGVVLYEMLTGCLPFRGEHEAALMYSIVNEEPEPLQTYLPDAAADLVRIIDRLLRKNPDRRYQTARDVADDLRRLAAGSPESLEQFPSDGKARRAAKRSVAGASRARRKKWIWMTAAGLVIGALILTPLLLLRKSEIRLNPERTLRTLQIPSVLVDDPALSRDGNWLAYSALDEDRRWDVYVLNIATEEPYRVTSEKYVKVFGVDISPDMSQIVYGCLRADSVPQETKLVSFHGGISRTLADYGIFPRWNPNGQRIGYIHLAASLKFEIWGVNPDGSDNRLEFADSLTRIQSGEPLAFCWSPSGASIAWVRNFPQGYGEVMVCDLKRGGDRQLTAEGKSVGSLTWTSNDRIIFPMNKSGNMDLWAMTSGGKGLLQITQGAVPMYYTAASTDCRRLVYDQREVVQYLWAADLNGKNERQVTFDDVRVQYATFSPDKRHIMAIMGDVDWSKPEMHLYIMDPYGKNRRRLTSGSQIVDFCCWSFDGSWLAYSSHGMQEPQDSSKVYLIRPFDPGAPRYVAKGLYVVWISSEEFIIPSTFRKTFQYSVRGDEAKQIPCEDSTSAIRMPGRDYLIVADRRKGREGIWIEPIDARGKVAGSPRKLGSGELLLNVHVPDLSYVLYEKAGVIWKMSLPNGKAEVVGHLSPGNRAIVDVSADGKEILIIKGYPRSRFVMIENPFK